MKAGEFAIEFGTLPCYTINKVNDLEVNMNENEIYVDGELREELIEEAEELLTKHIAAFEELAK